MMEGLSYWTVEQDLSGDALWCLQERAHSWFTEEEGGKIRASKLQKGKGRRNKGF